MKKPKKTPPLPTGTAYGYARVSTDGQSVEAQVRQLTARQTNQAHIAAVAAFDPEPAATLTAQLDHALSVARQDA